MGNSNPFSLSFGKEPKSFIKRELQSSEIIDAFTSESPAYQACMITGVRGSGKTVALTNISNMLNHEKNWIVVNINPEMDLLHSLAAELSNRKDLLELFRDARINLSFLGFGLEIDGEPPVTDIVVALRRMLLKLKKSNKRLLVCIDEVYPSQEFRKFASQFQIFVRENLEIYLLMTGLFENIDLLQNEKTLTFLYRAPKISLTPLNTSLMAASYMENLGIEREEAQHMAQATKGYSFAFQLLGYLCWTKKAPWTTTLPEFDAYIEEYSYDKIWSECSETDKEVLAAMCDSLPSKVEAIRDRISMSSSLFSIYRKRLLRKGLVVSTSYGYLDFALPRFKEYIERSL